LKCARLDTRLLGLAPLLMDTIAGRYKQFPAGKYHPSAIARCTFEIGFAPNQYALRAYRDRKPLALRPIKVYFAGGFDVCCGGQNTRCAVGALLSHSSEQVLIRPSIRPELRQGFEQGNPATTPCLRSAIAKLARSRNLTVTQALDRVLAAESLAGVPHDASAYERMGREMAESTFCLVPPGDTFATSRLVSALAAGCIPVPIMPAASPPSTGPAGPFGFSQRGKGRWREVLSYLRAVPWDTFWLQIDATAFIADPIAAVQPLLDMDPRRVSQLQAALRTQRANVLLQASGAVVGAATRLLERAADCRAFAPKQYLSTAIRHAGLPRAASFGAAAAPPQRPAGVSPSHARPTPAPQSAPQLPPSEPACPLLHNTTVVITAHVCSEGQTRILATTLESVRRYAPGACVVLIDSSFPEELGPLPPHVSATVRLDNDGGQLSALQRLGELGDGGVARGRIVFLQHSTPLIACLSPRRNGCVVSFFSRKNNRVLRFYRTDPVSNGLLNAAGSSFPNGNFTPALHCAIDLMPAAHPAFAHFGLWPTAGEPAAAVRQALYRTYAGRRSLNAALEVWCGAAAALANGWPNDQLTCFHANVIKKVHGDTYDARTCRERPGTPSPEDRDIEWLQAEFGDAS
jgi:hypothetical protein